MNDAQTETTAIILDYLPHGRDSGDRRRMGSDPLAQAIDTDSFRLYELVLGENADVSIGDDITLRPRDERVDEFREITHADLSSGANAELDYVVEEVVEADEKRFVTVYNEAQPITLRLHQLNLLPGIGEKLRDDILDARKRQPFEDFLDLKERVPSLHNPAGIIRDRILQELRDDDVKYALFRGDGPY